MFFLLVNKTNGKTQTNKEFILLTNTINVTKACVKLISKIVNTVLHYRECKL